MPACTQRRDGLLVLSLVISVIAACHAPSVAHTPAAFPVAQRVGPGTPLVASQLSVGFRIVPTEDGKQRFKLVAVVHDVQGEQTSADLGAYVGKWSEVTPVSGELLRIRIRRGEETEAVSLIPGPDFLEARHKTNGGKDTLIERIPTPNGTRFRLRDPAIESLP